MKVVSLARYAAGFMGTLFLVVGCGSGSQGAPMPSGLSIANLHADRGRAWMARDASKEDLLYVSSEMDWDVDVFSFPEGKREGKLTGLTAPLGLCSDQRGNVFVPNGGASDILEYAHGGTTPIATLTETNQSPEACSVDTATGNLAVANITTNGDEAGSVAIYRRARGSPQTYPVPNMFLVYECGYDNASDLFVDGLTKFQGTFIFAELPKGGTSFNDLTIDAPIALPGGVQWDGKYLAVGDAQSGVIYRTDGAAGKVEATTTLRGSDEVLQFWVQNGAVAAPSYYTVDAGFWKYPHGGRAFQTVLVGSPWGVTVSRRRD
jgi:hypothetical protein